MTYDDEYAYMVLLYGELFKNILNSMRKGQQFKVPKRYKEATEHTKKFYDKWGQAMTQPKKYFDEKVARAIQPFIKKYGVEKLKHIVEEVAELPEYKEKKKGIGNDKSI